jgi:hypothetical protein
MRTESGQTGQYAPLGEPSSRVLGFRKAVKSNACCRGARGYYRRSRRRTPGPIGSSHSLPVVRMDAGQTRPLVLFLRPRMEHLRHGRRLPGMSRAVDVHTMPFLLSLVGAFRLVSALAAGAGSQRAPEPAIRGRRFPAYLVYLEWFRHWLKRLRVPLNRFESWRSPTFGGPLNPSLSDRVSVSAFEPCPTGCPDIEVRSGFWNNGPPRELGA